MRIIAALLLALALTGCATLSDNQAAARLSVTYAVAKVVDGDEAKAAKVREIAGDVLERLQSETASIAALDDAVRKQIPWGTLAAADRLLVEVLLDELRTELEARIGGGLLSQAQRVQVATVISWIISATHL